MRPNGVGCGHIESIGGGTSGVGLNVVTLIRIDKVRCIASYLFPANFYMSSLLRVGCSPKSNIGPTRNELTRVVVTCRPIGNRIQPK